MKKGISQVQFAKLDGCSPKTVRDYIKTGALKPYDDGTLDPNLVGGNWRKRTYKPASEDQFEIVGEPVQVDLVADLGVSDTTKRKAERLMLSDGFEMLETHEAERKKQNYLALRQELEYFKESGKVALINDITDEVAKQLQNVRAILLTISSKLASKVIGCKDAEEARLMIHAQVVRALNEITIDNQQI